MVRRTLTAHSYNTSRQSEDSHAKYGSATMMPRHQQTPFLLTFGLIFALTTTSRLQPSRFSFNFYRAQLALPVQIMVLGHTWRKCWLCGGGFRIWSIGISIGSHFQLDGQKPIPIWIGHLTWACYFSTSCAYSVLFLSPYYLLLFSLLL